MCNRWFIEQKNDIIVLSYEYFPDPNSVGFFL